MLIPQNKVALCMPRQGVPMYFVAYYDADGFTQYGKAFSAYEQAKQYARWLALHWFKDAACYVVLD